MQSINKVVLIGSGNVASNLSYILFVTGVKIVQVFSPHLEHALEISVPTKSEATEKIENISKDADLYIIAVKDDAIEEINKNLRLPGKIVVHTSGAVNLESINQISENTGIFYPLQTFSKTLPINWDRVPILIEASNPETLKSIKEFAWNVSKSVFEMDSAKRKKIHVAAVFANNFVNHLLGEAEEILGEEIPLSILEPLVRETVDKAFSQGIEASQTGPAKRRDMKTIEAHITMLNDLPEAQNIYHVITDAIIRKYSK